MPKPITDMVWILLILSGCHWQRVYHLCGVIKELIWTPCLYNLSNEWNRTWGYTLFWKLTVIHWKTLDKLPKLTAPSFTHLWNILSVLQGYHNHRSWILELFYRYLIQTFSNIYYVPGNLLGTVEFSTYLKVKLSSLPQLSFYLLYSLSQWWRQHPSSCLRQKPLGVSLSVSLSLSPTSVLSSVPSPFKRIYYSLAKPASVFSPLWSLCLEHAPSWFHRAGFLSFRS